MHLMLHPIDETLATTLAGIGLSWNILHDSEFAGCPRIPTGTVPQAWAFFSTLGSEGAADVSKSEAKDAN